MKNAYMVYFGNKPFYIVDHLWPSLYAQTGIAGTIIGNHPDTAIITKTIRDMNAPGTRAVIILTDMVEYYWQVFRGHFTCITAGGGIVFNEKNEVLFIFRREKWDLPKGKCDDGESIEDCAVREVKEETGLTNVFIDKCLGNTYHVYREKDKTILKTSVWYIMKAPGHQQLIPQESEEITTITWRGQPEWQEIRSNTYPSTLWILEQLDGELRQLSTC